MKKIIGLLIAVIMCLSYAAAAYAGVENVPAAEGESSAAEMTGDSAGDSAGEVTDDSAGESADAESTGDSAEGGSEGDSAGGAIPSGGGFGDVKTGAATNSVILINQEGVSAEEGAADIFEIADGAEGVTESGVSGLHLENDSIHNSRNEDETFTQGISGVTFVDVSGTVGGETGFYTVTETDNPLARPEVGAGSDYNTVIILDNEDQIFSRQGNEIEDGAAVAIGGGTADDLLTVDRVYLWTKGFKRTNLFADDMAVKTVVRNSRLVCPGAENYKLGWQALYGGARCTLLQNGACWFYNDEIVTEGWGALSIDGSPGLALYAVNCKLDTLGGGYILLTPGDGFVNFYGVKADSAQYGLFIAGTSRSYIHARDDADEAALEYYTEEDAAAENCTEDGRSYITADYAVYLTHQGGLNSPTTEGYLFAENSVLSTENIYGMADNSHFINDTYGGTSWFWTEMWRGSTCLCRSTNATFEFDNVELISRTGVIFRTVVNWEGAGKDFTFDADTQAVGNSLIMRNMDVTGDVRNDDIYRNLYVDMTDASLTGAFVSTTVEGWNDMFSVESLETSPAYAEAQVRIAEWQAGTVPNATYNAEYPYAEAQLDLEQVSANMTMPDYGVLNGICLTLHDGAVWNVTGGSQLLSLTIADGAVVNADGYEIYIDCTGFDPATGTKATSLSAGEYSNVVFTAAGDAADFEGESAADIAADSAGDSAAEPADAGSAEGESADAESAGDSAEGESGDSSADAQEIEVTVTSWPADTEVVLTGAALLDKDHNGAVLDVKVVNGMIAEVGEGLTGDEYIDLSGCTLMPGMIDSHVHIASTSRYNLAVLKQFCVHGITSVREEGMLSTENEEDYLPLIEEANADPAFAYLVSCGKYLDETGGYGTGPTKNMGIIISNADEAAAEILHKAELGYPQVKVGINSDTNRMNTEEFTAVINTAHEQGMYVAAHVSTSVHLEELAGYGIDESAHTPEDAMSEDLIAFMTANHIAMNTSGATSYRDTKVSNLANFYQAGGIVTVGTDKMSGYSNCMESLLSEMQVLTDAGLSVQEVITCATANNAEALGLNTGLIAAGYEADLIAVPGAVDGTFSALTDISFVMNDGAVIAEQQ